jgi:hypothetical protein
MAVKSNYWAQRALNHILRNTASTPPATVYLALYTSDPTVADSGTEVSGNGYARVACAFNAATTSGCANTSDTSFPAATGSWGTVTHMAVRDASTAGNLLYFGPITSFTVSSGNIVTILAGNLVINET